MHRERYKFLSIRYDEERDNEFNEANFDFKNGDIDQEQLKVKMQEIKWDVAWNLFDEVNEQITPFKPQFGQIDIIEEIDMNSLDHEEAQAITKQKIYDLAEQTSSNPRFQNKIAVLAILCAHDHFVHPDATESSMQEDRQYEDLDEGEAYSNAGSAHKA